MPQSPMPVAARDPMDDRSRAWDDQDKTFILQFLRLVERLAEEKAAPEDGYFGDCDRHGGYGD